uniref:hypothetical protein n=1 Tax=Francisella tularensis TaxID=263 RepID=UPI001C0EAE9E
TGSVPTLALGDPIPTDLNTVRDVVDLLRRLVFTVDARILLSTIGLNEFLKRWRSKYGEQPVKVLSGKLERPSWFQ